MKVTGLILLLAGGGVYAVSGLLAENINATRHWQRTEAVILASDIVQRPLRTGYNDRLNRDATDNPGAYRPVWDIAVQYRYSVDGQVHVGTRLSNLVAISRDDARFHPPGADLARQADRFATGRTVPVHYDPAAPDRSFLILADPAWIDWLRWGGVGAALAGLACFGWLAIRRAAG